MYPNIGNRLGTNDKTWTKTPCCECQTPQHYHSSFYVYYNSTFRDFQSFHYRNLETSTENRTQESIIIGRNDKIVKSQ